MRRAGAIRKAYTGGKKAIAIAFDVGVTFSGASYAMLDPGEIPKIYNVTRCGLDHHTSISTLGTPCVNRAFLHPHPLAPTHRDRNTWTDLIVILDSFPGQVHEAGNTKIPSILWYDKDGNIVRAGAEVEEQSNNNKAEARGRTKVEL